MANIKIFIACTAMIVASLLNQSCTPDPKQNSEVKDLSMPEEGLFDFSKCACEDTACWQKETAAKTAEQLRCAKESLSTAFPVIGTVADLITSADDLSRAKADLATIESGFKETSSIFKLIQEFSPGCVKNFATIGAEATSMMEKTVTTINALDQLSKASDLSSIEFRHAQDGAIALLEVAGGFGKLASAMTETLSCLDQYLAVAKSTSQAANEIKSFSSRIKSFSATAFRMEKKFSQLDSLKRLNVIKTIGTCGIRMVKGLHTALNNASCLASDFETLRQQRAAIIRQTDNLAQSKSLSNAPNSDQIKSNANLCLGESRNASATLMAKFGAYSSRLLLDRGYSESSSSYAAQCANSCSKNTTSCSDFLKTQDFGPGCSNFCSISQSSSAIATCVSTCCLNDSSCRESALEQVGFASTELSEKRAVVSENANALGSHCGQGNGERELVRDISSTYVSYTPKHETCTNCCESESFEDGSFLAESDRPSCVNICVLRGKELGKVLSR